MEQITQKVQTIFRSVMNDQHIVLNNELSATDVDAWDSMSHINLILMIEDEFSIRFSDEEVSGLENVGELLRAIKTKQA